MRPPFWLLLPLTGCNCILGQELPRPTLSMSKCRIWVPRTSQVEVPFTVERTSPGPLTVRAISLPDGVTASDVVLGNDESSGSLVLTASSSSTLAATSEATFELRENLQIDDQTTATVGVSGLPGTLDTTWGTDGVVTLPPLGYPTSSYVIDIDSQGRVLVGGRMVESEAVVDLVIARYLPDSGALDTTFGSQHVGYIVVYPRASDGSVLTYPVGLRVDTQDRVLLANERNDPQQHCVGEVRRWTANGGPDKFTPYSDQVNGTGYSGAATGLVLEPDGQIVLLAWWNYDGGVETLLQTLEPDGLPESTYHITLEPGTLSSQHFTQMYDVAMDDRGGFVLGGRQYSGSNWAAGNGPIDGAIARVGADGLRDTSFGTNAYVSFDPSIVTLVWGVAIDPVTKSIIGVGSSADAKLSPIVRLDGITGEAAGFGHIAVDACHGGASQGLTQVMVDCRSRIIATGPCSKDALPNIGTVRTSIDGVVDAHFGSAGGVMFVAGDPRGAKLAPDERIYVVGDSGTNAAVWRFWP